MDFVSQYEMSRNLLHDDMLTLSSGSSDFESISDTNARSVEKLLREYIARTERSQISKGFEQLIHSMNYVVVLTLVLKKSKVTERLKR